MRHILRQVNDFLNDFKKEVVIIDFHEFPTGFDKPEAYKGLEKLVNAMLGELRSRIRGWRDLPADF